MTAPPLPEAELLLARAALDDGTPGAAAWEQWRRDHAIEELDGRTGVVAAMLHGALSRSWPAAPGLQRLRGSARHLWARHALATRAVAALAAERLPILLHREAALALTGWYPAGARPLRELDLFVAEAGLQEFDHVLRRIGWATRRPMPPRRLLPFLDGLSYRRSGHIGVRLLWHAFGPADPDDVRAEFPRRAEDVVVGEMRVRRPDRAALLLMTALAAARGASPRLLCLADLSRLASAGASDESALAHAPWTVAAVAAARELATGVAQALPEAAPMGLMRALDHWQPADGRAAGDVPDARGLVAHWRRYRGISRARRLRHGVAGFASHLIAVHRWSWGTSLGATLARGARRGLAGSTQPAR